MPSTPGQSPADPTPLAEAAPGARSGKVRQEKRDRIIDAAVDVFADKGFRAARISDIARAAGVADGTIYLYFDNKDELLITIFEEKMGELLERLHVALSVGGSATDRMRVYARFHFEQLRTYPALAQVLQVELRQSTRFFTDYRPVRLWEYLGLFEELIKEGQERGLLRADVDTQVIKWAFFGALDEISIQWVLSRKRDRINLDQTADQVVDVFLRGMALNSPA